MHNQRDHAWSIRHMSVIRQANMDSDILYKIDHTSGENGFPLNVGESLTLPDGRVWKVARKELRYVAKPMSGAFETTAYLDVYVTN